MSNTTVSMRSKFITIAYLILGVVIVILHLRFGLLSIFTFRENEHWLSWVMIILGPLLTFPAFLIGFRHSRVAAWSLFCGATLSLFFMLISEGLHGEHVFRFAIKVSAPMYLLAIMCLLREKA